MSISKFLINTCIATAIFILFLSCNSTQDEIDQITNEYMLEEELDLSAHSSSKFDQGFLEVNNVSLHYIAKGNPENPLLLFVHGAPERAEAWYSYLKYFSENYYTVAFTTRGNYPSSIPTAIEDYTSDKRAMDVHMVANALGHEEYTLVGHDWGAATAWQTAIMFPEEVKKLIVFSTPHPIMYVRGYHEVPEHQELLDNYIPLARDGVSPWNREATLDNNVKHFRDIVFTEKSKRHIPYYIKRKYMKTWKHNNGASIDGVYNRYKALDSWPLQYIPSCSFAPFLIVDIPVLQFYGEDDPFGSPLVYNLQNNDCVSNIEYVSFEDGDHWIHHEYKP